MNVEKLIVLGSTGSIGTQTLDVVRRNQSKFAVEALAAGRNISLLLEQIEEFQPKFVYIEDKNSAEQIAAIVLDSCAVITGSEGMTSLMQQCESKVVIAAIVGFAGLESVVAALENGKDVALANKEALVVAGELVTKLARGRGRQIVPMDSEHNAIYQCMKAVSRKDEIEAIVLTASGGPFLNRDLSTWEDITPEEALKHPRWEMGSKISIDSATMMNKGLELIEAHWLFDLPSEKIEVLVHPQSLVHGIVKLKNGTQLAAVAATDMRVPIAHALEELTGHSGIDNGCQKLDLGMAGKLEFFNVDKEKFKCLELCRLAIDYGYTYSAILNAANEIAVERFLCREIKFSDINCLIKYTIECYENGDIKKNIEKESCSLESLGFIDSWARQNASKAGESFRNN